MGSWQKQVQHSFKLLWGLLEEARSSERRAPSRVGSLAVWSPVAALTWHRASRHRLPPRLVLTELRKDPPRRGVDFRRLAGLARLFAGTVP